MKSFEDYFQDSIDRTDGSVVIWEKDFKQIQLDAMKEGMQRVAKLLLLQKLTSTENIKILQEVINELTPENL